MPHLLENRLRVDLSILYELFKILSVRNIKPTYKSTNKNETSFTVRNWKSNPPWIM